MSKFIPSMGITETETELPGYINLVDRKSKQSGGYESETSSELSLTSSQSEMVGGAYSQTSEMVGGSKKNNYSTTSDMVGGAYSQTSTMRGGNGLSSTSSMVGGRGYSATSSMKGGNSLSVTSDYKPAQSNVNELVSMLTSESDMSQSNTNTEELETQLKNILKGGKPKNKYFGLESAETFDMAGGNNPGFKAFLDLKKYIAEQLKVSNGPKAAKVAGAVQRETKEKNPNVKDGVEIAKLAKEAFNANKEKYKKMLH